jgi:cation:H+ antiporter
MSSLGTASAALNHDLGIAIGNALRGIALQTVVLVALDAFGLRGGRPLTYRATSLQLMLEGALVIAVSSSPSWERNWRRRSSSGAWRRADCSSRASRPWASGWSARPAAACHVTRPPGRPKRKRSRPVTAENARPRAATNRGHGTTRTVLVFAAAALVTLAGGVLLEASGSRIADHIGMSGVLFGSTVQPRRQRHLRRQRLPAVLFLMASILSGSAVLPQAQSSDIYLAALGILLTVIYMCGLVFRPSRRIIGMGLDSLPVLILYAVGIAGLVTVSHSG